MLGGVAVLIARLGMRREVALYCELNAPLMSRRGSPGRRAEAHRRGPGRRVGGVRNGQLAPKPEPTTRTHLRFGSARARSSEA